MLRITVELISAVDPTRSRELGRLDISNDGTGDGAIGNYDAILHAEYTPPAGRIARVEGFRRTKQSVWSLVGAALKQMGHTRHVNRSAASG